MASNFRPAGTQDAAHPAPSWRRALQVLVGTLLVVASVVAQALALTPVAIALLVVAVISLAPLALPTVEP
ncbi:MAG: hypothetical protein ACJ76Z_04850 [Thermoleophilaceae bacterium]